MIGLPIPKRLPRYPASCPAPESDIRDHTSLKHAVWPESDVGQCVIIQLTAPGAEEWWRINALGLVEIQVVGAVNQFVALQRNWQV